LKLFVLLVLNRFLKANIGEVNSSVAHHNIKERQLQLANL